jgi:DNA processing protein
VDLSRESFDLLRLTLIKGLGPMLIARLVEALGSPSRVLTASPAQLASVRGIGQTTASRIASSLQPSEQLALEELALAKAQGVQIVATHDRAYPEPLRTIPNAPPILYVRGSLAPEEQHLWGVAIVGSRRCSQYGIEQAERFAGVLAGAGLTIVSGGARGIDTAAHRGAIRSAGRTIAVMGCGLCHCYPPENRELYDQIAGQGAVVSELPMNSSPQAENFPARNRIISGMALGVLVIEAGDHSGALITARQAAEVQNREVMAVPGRVDSPCSIGSHELLKKGGASLVTEPGDVLEILRTPARHQALGTFQSRYADKSDSELFASARPQPSTEPPTLGTPTQQRILASLTEPKTIDQLAAATQLTLEQLRGEVTLLEIQRRIRREGARLTRA